MRFFWILCYLQNADIFVTYCAEQFVRRRVNAIFAILEYDWILTATDMLH